MKPLQPGDVVDTYADIDNFIKDFGYKPRVSLETGISNFIDWYFDFYKIK